MPERAGQQPAPGVIPGQERRRRPALPGAAIAMEEEQKRSWSIRRASCSARRAGFVQEQEQGRASVYLKAKCPFLMKFVCIPINDEMG